MFTMRQLLLVIALALSSSCASRPMFIGPPTSMPAADTRLTVGGTWAKPIESSDVGIPQLDVAYHLPVAESFDLAVRGWSLGGGLQGRLQALSRERGAAVDLMVAPLVGVSALADYREEDDERFLPPIDVEFLVMSPVVAGLGVGLCSVYLGAEPIVHVQPDLFVMRAAAVGGFSCPTTSGQQISPEVAFELPVLGGGELRPEDGYLPGERRHPLLAQVVRFGVAFSF